jgi:predicted small secreted protein
MIWHLNFYDKNPETKTKSMKKIIVIVFALVISASFAGCNNNEQTGHDKTGASSSDSANVAPSDSSGRQY